MHRKQTNKIAKYST